jgi:hypothetical protein
LPAAALAQTPAAPPQLSPKAAYDEAMHPLEVTRHSVANWSEIEQAALAVTMDKAHTACGERDPESYSGADLIQLARLCALGQSFPAAVAATTRYIGSSDAKPELTSAYSIQTDAYLRMKDEPDALASAEKMLDAVPYDTLVAETVGEAISFMEFVYTPDALALAVKREPMLLASLRSLAASQTPAAAATAPAYPGAEPPQPAHELYVDGISLAVLQQLMKTPAAETAATVAALDAALPTTLAPDDNIPIAVTRRRYALLGKPLPDIAHPAHPANPKKPVALQTLDLPNRLPQLPAVNAITGLLLFPDWCAQCIRMALKLPQSVFTVAGHEAYLYGLLAPTVEQTPPLPAPTAKPQTAAPVTPADASNLLRMTPTLVVDPSLLDQFAATDVPYLILTDAQGIVRVLQPVGDDALEPGGPIDSAIALVGSQWPSPKLKPPSPTQPPAAPKP